MTNLVQSFVLEGAHLNCSVEEIRERLTRIKVFLFDWDGVFNEGVKYGDQGSPFAEADSMGTNLVRLGYWLRNNGEFPIAGIITGAVNAGAEYFAKREHFDICMRGFNNKRVAWEKFLEWGDVQPEEVAFVYDDVIDLPIAEACGLRFCVRRDASPAFRDYVLTNDLCDYITAREGGQGAVREVCEFILAVDNSYDSVVRTRFEYAEDAYVDYVESRNRRKTEVFLAPGIT